MAGTTILGAIAAHAVERPQDPALVAEAETLGWADLLDRIRAAAAGMAARGVRPGDRVALLMATGAEAAVAYLAAIAAGAAAVPMPMSLRPAGLGGLLSDCAPALIVADPAGAEMLGQIETVPAPAVPLPDLLSHKPDDRFPLAQPPDAPFNIIYSSGTTGTPKGIVHSHAMRNGQAARTVFGVTPAARMLLATPIYSNTTLMPLLTALFHGGAVRLMGKFDAGEYLRLAQDWRATHTMLVPVQYRRILDHPGFDGFDLSAMQVKQSTSAPFDASLMADVLARFPGRMISVYGLTEGGVSCALDASAFPGRIHTLGRPAAGVELHIIGPDDAVRPTGEVGEIVGRSPWMMSGYWNRPDLTEAFLWRDPQGGVFFRSGDLGFFDADGFLHPAGRRKEMINSGGFNIYPVDLEAALLSHPAVAEAAAFAIPSPAWGETPFACVVLRPGAAAEAAEVLDWANARLGRTQRIHGLDIRPDLPRSSIGKVAKPDLAQAYRDRAGG